MRTKLREAVRIVIKVGTSTLTYSTGKINFKTMDRLARVISDLVNSGKQVVLVTSGAIGIGAGKLNLDKIPQTIREKQAVAAIGQGELMHIYSKLFSEYGRIVAQILLTQDVLGNKSGRRNVINTFETLLSKNIVPIVNENDSVSVEEIQAGQLDTFSENDTLSAVVSRLVKADLLIMLSDIDGFYEGDPRKSSSPRMLSVVEHITPEIERFAGGVGTGRGTGGMKTKIEAARIATTSGVDVVILNGSKPDVITDVLNGEERGTLFVGNKH